MNPRIVVQIALFAVVGASVAAWAWSSFARKLPAAPPVAAPIGSAGAAAATSAPSPVPATGAAAEVLADGVAVINLHGSRR